MTPKFFGTINKGEFTLEHPERFKKYLTSLQYKATPARVEISVRRYRKKRSIPQNNYYWFCLNFIANELGDEPENLHVTFKAMFLVDRSKGLPIIKSTTQLDSKEFTDYIDKIDRKMAEMNIILPRPDDLYN